MDVTAVYRATYTQVVRSRNKSFHDARSEIVRTLTKISTYALLNFIDRDYRYWWLRNLVKICILNVAAGMHHCDKKVDQVLKVYPSLHELDMQNDDFWILSLEQSPCRIMLAHKCRNVSYF